MKKDLIGFLLGLGLLVLLGLAVCKSREYGFEEECRGMEADQFFDHNYRLYIKKRKSCCHQVFPKMNPKNKKHISIKTVDYDN